MVKLTKQQIFDTVHKHLLTQNKKAVDINETANCQYRTPEGLTCAVGCLISEDKYNKRWENKSVGTLPIGAFVAMNVQKTSEMSDFLFRLQCVHDNSPVSTWHSKLRAIAKENDLKCKSKKSMRGFLSPTQGKITS